MEQYNKQIRKLKFGWFMLLAGMVWMLGGCSHFGGTDVRPIWKERDQFVALERQDSKSGAKPVSNSHPASVSIARLSSILEAIELRMPGQKQPQPLLNETGIRILSENISQALATAAPADDVTFAYVGLYPVQSLMSIVKADMVTTGRLFVKDGQVNIIFGLLHKPVNERTEDRRLNPFTPGSREFVLPQEAQLVMKPGMESFTLKRPDWAVFPLAAPTYASAPEPSAEVPATAAMPAVTPTSPAPAASYQARPAPPAKKSVEERLMILKGLKEKGLITEEEYKAKRQEILNDL